MPSVPQSMVVCEWNNVNLVHDLSDFDQPTGRDAVFSFTCDAAASDRGTSDWPTPNQPACKSQQGTRVPAPQPHLFLPHRSLAV